MKTAWIACLILLFATSGFSSEPTTRPTEAPGKVLLLPFEAVGPDGPAWIGAAVQQNLLAELSRGTGREVVMSKGPGATDPAKALAAGRQAGAEFVVYGSFQLNGSDLRITGQILDVISGAPTAGLKATGSMRDLFALEDTIAQQARRALPTVPRAGTPAQAEILPQPLAIDAVGPLRIQRETTYPRSDLNRAVATGQINVPPAPNDTTYGQRSYWYTYGQPYYAAPWYYGPAYYPYYRPAYWSPSILGPTGAGPVGVIGMQDFRKGFSNTQAYVPMTVTNPPPNVATPRK